MFRTRLFAALGAAALFLAPTGVIADVVDQEQLITEDSPTAIGGASEQELAQSFTVGVTGYLTQIRIPVACSTGELIVEIQRLNADGEPSGAVVTGARVAAGDLPAPPGTFRTIRLSPPLLVEAGDRYAIVLKNETGVCSILSGPEGDSYPGGQYFYDSRPNPPGWVGGKDRPAPSSTPGDMPFQTIIDDGVGGGSSNRCFGNTGSGPVPLPFADDLPICRCLSDPGLNQWRCRLLHPDFFIVRRIPMPPFNAKDVITEEWAFTPLRPLDGSVRMVMYSPYAQKPAVYDFGKKSKPGSFEYLRVERNLKDMEMLKGAAVEFMYPMRDASSPFQKSFGFDPGFEE
ncbi:hypothetical protein PUV54_12270 [Hyphococcus flavus]|uniref:Uncharacterized protein n=1 Tax=Hyphococcus flavus TaxID=1866326 RepID=A0AAE9ZAL5_9PROT|nr:hypothetical protein [Hyphococcus flavus]WDI30728.1 hypothetical protein PUV54_12270 [Hyphococcus flavus]